MRNLSPKILIVGGGAREHALAWSLLQGGGAGLVGVMPGNCGMASPGCGTELFRDRLLRMPLQPDVPRIVAEAQRGGYDLVVCGPEGPLVGGLVDHLEAEGIVGLGPRREAARLEGSKGFTRALGMELGLSQPRWWLLDDPQSAARTAMDELNRSGRGVVIKADGLAGGKGSHVCLNASDLERAVHLLMVEQAYGQAGSRVVVEEMVEGDEVSLMVLTDGQRVFPFPVATDYKRCLDGDAGPNTGGMGAVAPSPVLPIHLQEQVIDRMVEPILAHFRHLGVPYRGIMYLGLMITARGPVLLEINVRPGDPETQVVLPLLEDRSLLPALMGAAAGRLPERCPWSAAAGPMGAAAVGVVLADRQYPNPPGLPNGSDQSLLLEPLPSCLAPPPVMPPSAGRGHPEKGADGAARALVFWGAVGEAGRPGDRAGAGLVAGNGRVATVVGMGSDLAGARRTAYRCLKDWGEVFSTSLRYRTDIGKNFCGRMT